MKKAAAAVAAAALFIAGGCGGSGESKTVVLTEVLPGSEAPAAALTENLYGYALALPLVYSDGEGNLTCGLAREWEVSSDGLTYSFVLRDGLEWSDGSPLTTESFVETVVENLEKAYLEGEYFYPGIAGLEDYFLSGFDRSLLDSAGIHAGAGNAVLFTLVSADPLFPYILQDRTFLPLALRNGETVSAGPYLVSEQSEEAIFLEDNVSLPGSYRDLVFLKSTAAAENGKLTEDAEIIEERYPGISYPESEDAVFFRTGELFLVNMAVQGEIFNDPAVREALYHFLPRKEICYEMLGGFVRPAYSLNIPGMPGSVRPEEISMPEIAPDDSDRAAMDRGTFVYRSGSALEELLAEKISGALHGDGEKLLLEEEEFSLKLREYGYDAEAEKLLNPYGHNLYYLNLYRNSLTERGNLTGWENGRYDELLAGYGGTGPLAPEAFDILAAEKPVAPVFYYGTLVSGGIALELYPGGFLGYPELDMFLEKESGEDR